jgi:TolA-binding protein
MRTRVLTLAAAAVIMLLVGGCSASAPSATAQMDVKSAGEAVGAPAPQGISPDGSVAQGVTTSVPAERQVIRTGYVAMRVDDPAKTAFSVHSLVAKYQGLISSEQTQANGDTSSSLITAQVPATQLDAFVADVTKLGKVDSVQVSAQDVTTQVVDLDARIKALQTSIDRMQQLLSQAQKIDDLLAIETQLSTRQAELDSLTAQRKYLGDQVAMSSVTVSLSPASELSSVDAPGFLSGLQSGWSAFISVIMVAITALGFLLPFLLVVMLVLVPLILIVIRQSRRHRAPKAPAEAEADQAPAGDRT